MTSRNVFFSGIKKYLVLMAGMAVMTSKLGYVSNKVKAFYEKIKKKLHR